MGRIKVLYSFNVVLRDTHSSLQLVNPEILKQIWFCWWPLLSNRSLDHVRLFEILYYRGHVQTQYCKICIVTRITFC